ncbi:HotDog domain-containing protein [Lasiosphaeria hispida]|uniref:HotDog domain-containing protein n=1 Tax=Lasiosphaeria hispida TaxID=260671 RepID=A0AAJ0MEH4_9PEZI|nr:HotDog domain-containing protein [Lasiosphaeria hispida]
MAERDPNLLRGAERVHELTRMVVEKAKLPDDHEWTNILLPHLDIVSTSETLPHPKVVFRFTVHPHHSNRLGNLHGGCIATLFDYCTTMPLALVSRPGFWHYLGVSRTLNTTYLRPVPVGTEVLIECEAVQVGRRLASLRGVMWRAGHEGEIFATCEHGKFNTDPEPAKI